MALTAELGLVRYVHVGEEFLVPSTRRRLNEKARLCSNPLALATTVASAQTPQTAPKAVAEGPAAKILASIPANAMTVTHWYKQSIYDPSDAKIGEIMDVLVDRVGKIAVLIVGVGGFLGMSEKDVAVPFNAVQFKAKEQSHQKLLLYGLLLRE